MRLDTVSSQLEKIKNILLDKLKPEGLISIIWYGSFARGEGGLLDYSGVKIPFGDYDIIVVTKNELDDLVKKIVIEQINIELGFKDILSDLNKDHDWYHPVDLNFRTKKTAIPFRNDLSTFNILSNYKVLWGTDFYKDLEISINSVDRFSAFRILNNRFNFLLGCSSYEVFIRK